MTERTEIMVVARGAKRTGNTRCEINIHQKRKVGNGMNDIQELVNIAGMTADAIKNGKLVWVVRCKDCKHRPTKDIVGLLDFPDNDVCPCQNSDDSWYSWYPADNWFCANGERK